VIDPASGRIRSVQPGPTNPGCYASTPSFTPDDHLLAVFDGCIHVVVWDLRSGRVVRTVVLPRQASGPPVLSPNGRYVLVPVPGGAFARADLASGTVVEVPGAASPGNALAVAPDGRFYALGREDGTVDEYDAASLRLVRHHLLGNAIRSLVFSPDSRQLAVVDTSDVVRVWDTCDVCENPARLARLAATESVRALTPRERATFDVP
jgi:WD40 repeat protein